MDNLIIINGVNITPYIAKNGYQFQSEQLHRDNSKRSIADGGLTIDRIGCFATIEITIKEQLPQEDVHKIQALETPTTLNCSYYNVATGRIETGTFYLKIKSPKIKFFRNDKPIFSSFTLSLKSTRRYRK